MNPMDLKRGIDKAVTAAVEKIKGMATPCEDSKAIAQVGTISANSDEAVGKIIAQAMEKVGKEGVITVEEGSGLDNELDVVEGMQFDRATYRHTSSIIKTRCLQSTITRSYFFAIRRSPTLEIFCHCSRVSRRQADRSLLLRKTSRGRR